MNPILPATEIGAKVVIRSFEPADAARISALFQRHTAYQRDAAYWLWLNRLVPSRPSLVAVAEINGEIAAHYAILPVELCLSDGRVVLAGHGVHAFVSPEHRQSVSIFQVSSHAYRMAQAAGLQFVFGFPNANYRLVQEKIERWRCVSLFKAWTKPAARPMAGGACLASADWTDDAELQTAIEFWERADRHHAGMRIAGQARWWLERYLRHPQQPYQFHWLVIAGERRGLVVAKIFQADGEARAHLVDYVLADDGPHGALIAAFEERYAGLVSRFVHWPVDREFTAALVEHGYRPDGFETWFGLRALGGAALDPKLLEATAWRLPMGFSDAF